MAEARASSNDHGDEVDLSVVVNKFTRFFAVNGKLILIATLIGLVAAILVNVRGHKHYTGELVIGSTILNTEEMHGLMDGWEPLLSTPDALAGIMGCPPEIVRHIGGLSADPLPEDFNHTNYMLLTVTLHDTSDLRAVQDAIVNGIRNNEYVKKRAAIRLAGLDEQIKKASTEIARLDSTREFIESLSGTPRTDNGRVIIDLSDISKQKVAIQANLSAYRESRAFGDGAMLVIGFAAIKGPKPGLLTILAIGIAAGFLFGYLIAAIRSLVRLTKRK